MYTIIWRFTVKPDAAQAFEKDYSADGRWAQIFRTAAGYVGTDLLRDTAKPNVYLTLDHWQSAAAYTAFNTKSNPAYQALDQACEAYTLHEEKLGTLGS